MALGPSADKCARIPRGLWIALSALLLLSTASATRAGAERVTSDSAVTSIALLHLEPSLGRLDDNIALVERGIRCAVDAGADWVVTPELSLTGYRFEPVLALSVLQERNDAILDHFKRLSNALGVAIFLSHIDVETSAKDRNEINQYFNTLFVIQAGEISARHHKINVIPVSESWATAGREASLALVDGIQVGLLICADAWPKEHADQLAQEGAELLLSSANWWPGDYGPGNTWEARSRQTGLPFVVNNRTGIEPRFSAEGREFLRTVDMREAKSVYVEQGQRLVEHQSLESSVVILRWQHSTRRLLSSESFLLRLPSP